MRRLYHSANLLNHGLEVVADFVVVLRPNSSNEQAGKNARAGLHACLQHLIVYPLHSKEVSVLGTVMCKQHKIRLLFVQTSGTL